VLVVNVQVRVFLNPVDFQLLEWILLVLGLSVPLAAPHGQDVLEVLGVIDAVAGGEHHLGGDQRPRTGRPAHTHPLHQL